MHSCFNFKNAINIQILSLFIVLFRVDMDPLLLLLIDYLYIFNCYFNSFIYYLEKLKYL
jgi:hypothetical protein